LPRFVNAGASLGATNGDGAAPSFAASSFAARRTHATRRSFFAARRVVVVRVVIRVVVRVAVAIVVAIASRVGVSICDVRCDVVIH
jgi:hypothetical protein